jgi:hypothetical protein
MMLFPLYSGLMISFRLKLSPKPRCFFTKVQGMQAFQRSILKALPAIFHLYFFFFSIMAIIIEWAAYIIRLTELRII